MATNHVHVRTQQRHDEGVDGSAESRAEQDQGLPDVGRGSCESGSGIASPCLVGYRRPSAQSSIRA